jgi:subtilisin family serine protease
MLRDAADLEELRADAAVLGYSTVDVIPQLAAIQLAVPVGSEERAMAALAADPRIAHVEPNSYGSAQLVPDDAVYDDYQWDMRKIGMEAVWDVTTGSPSIIVAVLDTGVDAGHPDLAGNVLPGYDFVNDDPDASDDSSHGTYIAGVIAAIGNNGEGVAGMAWRTKILPVKVLDRQGLGPDAAVSKGIIFAVENRARVINLSSGTPFPSRLLEEAIRFAERRNVLVVAAAGNTGDRGNEVIYPAAYSTVLAVAATDEQDAVPPFSQRQSYVSVAAPGVGVPGTGWRGSENGPYILSSGTSAAAPHVSGLAALLLALAPDLTTPEIRRLIQDSADDVGPEPREVTVGAGRINALRTISAIRPVPAPSRVAPAPARAPEVAGIIPRGLPSLGPLPQPGPLPAEPSTWFFAEGNTMPSFDTWLVLQNPLSTVATARTTYMTQDGIVAERAVELDPNSRASIRVNDVVPNALVSIRVDSETTVFAERSIYFGHDGIGGVGTRSPARSWFLAEGSTAPPFDTWILIQNPNPSPNTARLTFMLESGGTKEITQPLTPQSRMSIHVNDVLPSAGFATAVTADLPIVVERSMYFAQGGGHGSMGVKTPGQTWFMAEGDTRAGFDTWILLQNPGTRVANVKITFLKEDGTTTVGYYALDPSTRLSLYADTVVPNTTFGARIESDQPIIVERSIYVAGGEGGHNSPAVPIPNTEWYLPEGSTRAPNQEILALLNPNQDPAQVEVTFIRADGRPPVPQTLTMRPTSRVTLDVNRLVPNSDLSARVVADKPIIVERSIYSDRGALNAPGETK